MRCGHVTTTKAGGAATVCLFAVKADRLFCLTVWRDEDTSLTCTIPQGGSQARTHPRLFARAESAVARAPTDGNVRVHTLSLGFLHSLTSFLSNTPFLSLTLFSLSLSLCHTFSLSHTPFLSLSPFLSLTHTLSLSHPFSSSHPFSLTHPFSLSHIHIHPTCTRI